MRLFYNWLWSAVRGVMVLGEDFLSVMNHNNFLTQTQPRCTWIIRDFSEHERRGWWSSIWNRITTKKKEFGQADLVRRWWEQGRRATPHEKQGVPQEEPSAGTRAQVNCSSESDSSLTGDKAGLRTLWKKELKSKAYNATNKSHTKK